MTHCPCSLRMAETFPAWMARRTVLLFAPAASASCCRLYDTRCAPLRVRGAATMRGVKQRGASCRLVQRLKPASRVCVRSRKAFARRRDLSPRGIDFSARARAIWRATRTGAALRTSPAAMSCARGLMRSKTCARSSLRSGKGAGRSLRHLNVAVRPFRAVVKNAGARRAGQRDPGPSLASRRGPDFRIGLSAFKRPHLVL